MKMSATRILELSRPILQRHRMFFTPSSYHWYSFLVLKRLCQCYVYIPNSCLLNTSVIWTIPLPPRPYIKSVLILFQTVLKWIHQYLRECSWNGITGLCWTGLLLCNFLFDVYLHEYSSLFPTDQMNAWGQISMGVFSATWYWNSILYLSQLFSYVIE